MEKLLWNEKLNIGVEIVDKAHANLFRIVGKLIELVNSDSNYQNACKEGVKYLEDYSIKHFAEEEAYMRSIRYSGYAKHKEIHDTFRDQTLVSLKKTLELSDYSLTAVHRFLNTMLGWLAGHIMTEDQLISGVPCKTNLYDYSTRVSVAAQAVSQAMNDMFHIDTVLVDDNYYGQYLGAGFYCRLGYDIDDGGKVLILMGAEDKLIRRGVGLIYGMQTMQDTEMVHEVALQIFEQFLHHMGGLFRSDAVYSLHREELLTSDEFRSDFATRYPYSILFETRLGRFVFCCRKWKPKRRKAPGTQES
ncbi:MAG: hemerythrin family protein [Hungatella sp.]|nr:hemerythrin family protein [Hungatella sp.]